MSGQVTVAAAATASRTLNGQAIIRAVKDAGVEYVLSVPDLHTSQGVLKRVAEDNELRLVRVCKEDECIGIAAGLTYGDKRALVLVQYTGFLYAMNAIRAVACEHKMPIVMMIGLLTKEPDVAPTESTKFGVRITEPLLDVIGIEHHYVDTDDDIGKIKPAIEKAYATSTPVALLIGRRPV
ncbi:MAG: thiamine pyrophosphate-binding protein [Hyphomicrobiaceae bacterium]